MKVVWEPVAWIARAYQDDDAAPDAPYVATSTVTVDEHRKATIRGLATSDYSPSMRVAYFAEAARWGVTQLEWSRQGHGRKRIITKAVTV